jgi:hypothetical protein
MERFLEAEWLDELEPEDPRALRSRRDLLRVNLWMLNCTTVGRALHATARLGAQASMPACCCCSGAPAGGDAGAPKRLVEIGAGDGRMMLQVARRLGKAPASSSLVLLDRQNIVAPATRTALEKMGWSVETVTADAFDWLEHTAGPPADAMIANLFMHHFSEKDLERLLGLVAQRTKVFVAVEPRRCALSALGGRLLWLIGCGRVTIHDAIVSVRAGFAGCELSRLWPEDGNWSLQERRAGLFGHVFVAQRKYLPVTT